MPQPVFLVTVDDPRANGRLTSPGWSGDPLFFADKDAESSDKKAVKAIDQWELNGCEPVPSYKGIAPIGKAERVDMNLQDWTPSQGLWDDKARPVMFPRTRHLHCYGGADAANPVGVITSNGTFGPNWCAWITRFAAPAETTLAEANINIKMHGGGLGYPSWRIYIPTRSTRFTKPCLCLNPYSRSDAEEQIVSVLDVDSTAGLESGLQTYVVYCELTGNQWIIGFGVNGKAQETRWVYSPPGTDIGNPHLHDAANLVELPICSPGKIEFQTVGQQAMFSIAPIVYPNTSFAKLKRNFVVPSKSGTVKGKVVADVVAACPAGTDCTAEVVTDDSNGINPVVMMHTNGSARPVCGVVGLNLPAVIGDVVTSPWLSSSGNLLTGKVSYERRSTWRGSRVRFTVRNPDGALSWKGNNVVTLSAAYQTGGTAPTLRKLLTGHLVAPDHVEEGDEEQVINCEAADFADSRLTNKDTIYTRSLGGFKFSDAFKEAGNRLGFSADRIVLTDCDDLWLPTPQVIGEPQFAWGAGGNWQEVLDTICKAVARTWGIDADGNLFARPLPAYSGTPDFVLTDAVGTASFSARLETGEFRNNVYTIVGEDGYRRFGWAQDAASEGTSTAVNFIGDTAQHVEIVKEYTDAQALATATLGRRSAYSHVLTWKPLTAQALDPGMFVQSQLTTPHIALNSVWMIVEERGDLDTQEPNELGWEQEFRLVRVV